MSGTEFDTSVAHQAFLGRAVRCRMTRQRLTARSRAQVARFFAGMDLVPPGVVRVEEWRQEPGTGGAGSSPLWGAVGGKR